MFYFFAIRPQKKEQKRLNLMLSELEIGDSVCTTAGFYGVIIDVDEDTFTNETNRSLFYVGTSRAKTWLDIQR